MLTHNERPVLSVALILDMTADWFRIPRDLVRSERRARRFARPRQAAMWLAVQLLPVRSLPHIARDFQRDRTTVIHALGTVERWRKDPKVAADLDALRETILKTTARPSIDTELAGRMAEETTEAFRAALVRLAADDPVEFIRRVARLALKEAPADGP